MTSIRIAAAIVLALASLGVGAAHAQETADASSDAGLRPQTALPQDAGVVRHAVTQFFDVQIDLPEEGPAEQVEGALILENRFESRTFTVTLEYPPLKAAGDVIQRARSGESVRVGEEPTRLPVSFSLSGHGKKRVILSLEVETREGIRLGAQKVGLYFRVDQGRYQRVSYEDLYVPVDAEPEVVVPETDSTELMRAIVLETMQPPAGVSVEPVQEDVQLPEGPPTGEQVLPQGNFQQTGEAQGQVVPRMDLEVTPPPDTASPEAGGGVQPSEASGPNASVRFPVGAGQMESGEATAGTFHVSGKFSYKGLDGSYHPARGWQVLLLKEIPTGGYFKLATTRVESDGTWSKRFSFPFYTGGYLRVAYSPSSDYVEMRQRNSGYVFMDPPKHNVNSRVRVGHRSVDLSSSGNYAGLGDIYQASMSMWAKFAHNNVSVTRSRPIRVFFPNTWQNCGSGGPWSCAARNGRVWLISSHTGDDVVHHELAHQLNYKYWSNRMPQGSGGSHTIDQCYNDGLGLSEGFANAVPPWVQHGAGTSDPDQGGGMDVENLPACACPGSTNEWHVAGFFWDLLDQRSDGLDGLHANNPVGVFSTYLGAAVTNDVLGLRSDYRSGASQWAKDAIDDVYAQSDVSIVQGSNASHTVVIDGRGSPGTTGYAIKSSNSLNQVDGTVQGVSVTKDGNDSESRNAAKGYVGGGADGFRTTGAIPNVTLCSPDAASVSVDGKEYHGVVIDGRGGLSGNTSYTLEAGNTLDIEHGTVYGRDVSNDPNDNASGNRATGSVGSGADGYLMLGAVSELSLSNPFRATPYVDGREYHTVVVNGRNLSGSTDYTLENGGSLEQASGSLQGVSVTADPGDNVSGSRATGSVGGGADGFRVTGALPSVSLTDPTAAQVLVDGQPFHTVLVDSRSVSGRSDYTIEGGGELLQVDGSVQGTPVTEDPGDDVSGEKATGGVSGGADGYYVAGGIPTVRLSDESGARAFVDGLPVHTLVITGRGNSGRTDYSIRAAYHIAQVSGTLQGRSVSIQSGDNVSGRQATGAVSTGADGFVVVGSVDEVHLQNPLSADVYVDGEAYHTVIINSRNVSGSTDYTIETSGGIRQVGGSLHGVSVTVDPNDSVSGTTATGRVSSGADAFVVTGSIENIELTNDSGAAVLIDGANWQHLNPVLPEGLLQQLRNTPVPQVPEDLPIDSLLPDTTSGGGDPIR